MKLKEAIEIVAREPSSVQTRARLALKLQEMGAAESEQVWEATVRLAAGRGGFFIALALCRRYLQGESQRRMIEEMARRFGADRSSKGKLIPPPLPQPLNLKIPSDEKGQVALATQLGLDVGEHILPQEARLPEVPIFSQLAEEDFVALALALEEGRVRPGKELMRQGEIGEEVFLLGSGLVRVVQERPDGREVELAITQAPAVIGEMALLTSVPRRASVLGLTPGIVWKIDANKLEELNLSHPGLVEHLLLLVKRRMLENLFQSSELLAEFKDRDRLLSAFKIHSVGAEEEFIRQGTEPPGLFVILHGEAEVWMDVADGSRVRLAVLSEGDAVGEFSLLTGRPTTASVWMPQGGVLLHLTSSAYQSLRPQLPNLEANLANLMEIRHGELQNLVTPFPAEFEEVDDSWLIDEEDPSQS